MSRVSPDGRYLVFVSDVGDEVADHDAGDCGGTPCRSVYVYTADGNGGLGRLACASCDALSSPMTSDAGFIFKLNTGATRRSSHLNHPLSDDGRWVFFSTVQPLLPEDHNVSNDVYEYDVLGGVLHLLSSGAADSEGAYFLDASLSGRDVFFATRDRLVGWDIDQNYDVYDARVNGGFPEPVASASCVGDACQGTTTSLAGDAPAPGSLAIGGSGNFAPLASEPASKPRSVNCRRGFAKRHVKGRVRCVRRKHAVTKKARRGK
jgi:hypothetical protein